MVDAIEEHCRNTYPEKYNKYLYRNVLFSIINIAIQASTQIADLIAENKRLREENEWQPIETAPYGKNILITGGYFISEISRATEYRTRSVEVSSKPDDSQEFWITGGTDYNYGQKDPTHWRLLPQPPKEQK